MPTIHPTAIVDPLAELADDAEIGPYVVIRGRVRIGCGVVIDAHSMLNGRAEIGDRCFLGPSAFVGTAPQHRQYDRAMETGVVVGPGTVVREGATIHRSIYPDRATLVGANCYLMCDSHVGHDCQVGDNVTLANGVLLGGHVTVGDGAFLGGASVFHQYIRIGRLAIVSGNEAISRDIPPFAAVRYGRLKGYNAVGCRRAGMKSQTQRAIRQVFLRLQRHRSVSAALAEIESELPLTDEVREVWEFIRTTKRGIQPSAPSRAAESFEAFD